MFVAHPEMVKMSCTHFNVQFLNVDSEDWSLLLSDKFMMFKYFRKLNFSN